MRERWKMPPLVKVYEALGALGDGRVRIESESRALVGSSDASKTYEVETTDGGREVSSNDNASYWQGYLGYPGIAVLIQRGLISCPPDNVIDALAGIPWKEINTRFKNDYDKTVAEVLRIAEHSGHDPDAIRAAAEAVLADLKKFAPTRGPRRHPPTEKKKPAGR